MSDWVFDNPPNVAVLTTNCILEGRPILYVSHDDDDGTWQFHTGDTMSESDARVVSLKRIVELDHSVTQLADLPLDWIAIRSKVEEAWQRFKSNEKPLK